MIKIVLTGSIATGKTTVANFMMGEKAVIIDTDLITHSIYNKPSVTVKKIANAFGQELIDKNGSINRPKLGELVFNNPDKLQMLNNIVHPDIRNIVMNLTNKYEELEKQQNKSFLVVYVVPLYFETGKTYQADYVVVSSCSRENQFKRLIERNGYSPEEADKRINSQIPVSEKVKQADYVIDTNQDIGKIENDVHHLLKNFKWDIYHE